MSKDPHIASIADRPIRTDAEDSLGRSRFAKSIADLILTSPAKETLRIGIYGGWGEGKTSVLRLIEGPLRAEGHPVVWITPLAAASREALVSELIRKLAEELGIKLQVAMTQWTKPLSFIASKSADAAAVDPRLKAAESFLGDGIRSILKKAGDDQVNAVFAQIRAKLGDRKLVVMVDDLDRVRPELVPEILLLLREALDQPNYFYILALDPSVVTRGLARMHEAWGDTPDFLEKIIELPRRLPAPSDEEVRAFIHEQIERSDRMLRKDILLGLTSVLSRNPRKLKLLLRYLASLSGVTSRLDDSEIDWESFYLCQMLRLEFSDEALRMADDNEMIKDLDYGAMKDRLASSTQADPAARGYHAFAPRGEVSGKRFKTIAEAIRMRGGASGRYGLRERLLLPDNPPLITEREFAAFLTAFAGSSNDRQKDVVEEAVSRMDAKRPQALASIFDHALADRQQALEVAVSAKTEPDIRELLLVVADITTIMEILVEGGALRSDVDGATRYHRLLHHVASWAQFVVPDYHDILRERERAFLTTCLDCFEGDGLLEIYERWDPFRVTRMGLPAGHIFSVFMDGLEADVESRLAPVLLKRFTIPSGLDVFWGDSWSRTKQLLFAANAPVFGPTHRHSFLRLAGEVAIGNPVISENFLTYIQMLGYAAFGRSSTFDREACLALVNDHELMAAVWQAALATPLQPRFVGDMAETRDRLVQRGVPESSLPWPPWFVATQQLFESDESGSGANS